MVTKIPSSPGKPEAPRRIIDIPAVPSTIRPLEQEGAAELTRRLVVGRDIHLRGEISDCDHLVVEGHIEVRIRECRNLDVAETGTFKGSAEIDTADIAGHFDGELVVMGRLTLRGSGQIVGSVRYGELAVEPGGRVSGSVEPLDSVVMPMLDAASLARDGMA